MYQTTVRRDPTAQQVDRRDGTREQFLERHEEACRIAHRRGPEAVRRDILAFLFPRIYDIRTLRLSWDSSRAKGGDAPGPDGRSYADYTRQESWQLLAELSDAIVAGTYRPGPDRPVPIPKSSGNGTRTLLLPNVADRVVQHAALRILQPLVDLSLDPLSFARPRRGTWQALRISGP